MNLPLGFKRNKAAYRGVFIVSVWFYCKYHIGLPNPGAWVWRISQIQDAWTWRLAKSTLMWVFHVCQTQNAWTLRVAKSNLNIKTFTNLTSNYHYNNHLYCLQISPQQRALSGNTQSRRQWRVRLNLSYIDAFTFWNFPLKQITHCFLQT
jgi:hypothetical protein